MCVVAWTATVVNVLELNDVMTSKGWTLNVLQFPNAVHMCLTMGNVDCVERLLADLREVRAKRAALTALVNSHHRVVALASPIARPRLCSQAQQSPLSAQFDERGVRKRHRRCGSSRRRAPTP